MATESWFLKIDGIVGESTDVAHRGEIDVESWSWGLTNSTSTGPGGGGGGGAGKAVFQDFHFVSSISTATPPLFAACATGTHVKEAILSGVRTPGKGKGTSFLTFTLRDVQVTSLQLGDSDATPPTQQFSVSYGKIEMSYIPQKATGQAGTAVTAGYDVKANKKL